MGPGESVAGRLWGKIEFVVEKLAAGQAGERRRWKKQIMGTGLRLQSTTSEQGESTPCSKTPKSVEDIKERVPVKVSTRQTLVHRYR